MAVAIVDLTKYAGMWIAQNECGTLVASADTFAELKAILSKLGTDLREVVIMQVPKDDSTLLL